MPKSVNKLNDNIEENTSSDISPESFDEEEYSSGLSEVGEKKAEQKERDKSKVEELKQNLDDELLPQENKELILDIIGPEKLTKEIIECALLASLTKQELERIKKNKKLILDATGQNKIDVYDLCSLKEISEEDLEKVKKNRDLILGIIGKGEIDIQELIWGRGRGEKTCIDLTEEELKGIKENRELILKITGMNDICVRNLCELSGLTGGELEKIKENKELILEILGVENLPVSRRKELSGLTKEELEQVKKICEGEAVDIDKIVMIGKFIKNINEDFIKRKMDYLDKCRENDNQLINDSEFNELFGKEGKFGKGEINQGKLGYCYFYSVCEILKKKNYFNVLIKTNLRKSKTGEGWDIRLPMGQPDGQWIHVSKDEIDKTFDVPNKIVGLKKGVSVNSDTQLGFKIIEIGFIKKALMSLYKNVEKEFLDSGDIKLTGEKIAMLEGDEMYPIVLSVRKSQNDFVLETLIGNNSFDNHWVYHDWNEDLIFNCFNLGLLVSPSVKESSDIEDDDKKKAEIEMDVDGKITNHILLRDVNIINKDKDIPEIQPGVVKEDGIFKRLTREKRTKEMLLDYVKDENGPGVVFSRGHAYSIERCYIDEDGNKRVWVVNPYHTGIKFDISLENAKKIFYWEVSYIDTDKLFR